MNENSNLFVLIVSDLRRLSKVRAIVRDNISDIWFIYWPLARVYRRKSIVSRNSDIVIEGFPRSGNTFAGRAFQLSQGRRCRVASHLHSTVQIELAVRWAKPCLVLIRDPEAAIASLALYEERCSLAYAYKRYIRFYSRIEVFRHSFVVGEFDVVTKDFGQIIFKLNGKFGAGFLPFVHNELNVKKCFDGMEDAMRARGTYSDLKVSRPLDKRKAQKESIRKEIRASVDSKLQVEARSVYERYLSYTD